MSCFFHLLLKTYVEYLQYTRDEALGRQRQVSRTGTRWVDGVGVWVGGMCRVMEICTGNMWWEEGKGRVCMLDRVSNK